MKTHEASPEKFKWAPAADMWQICEPILKDPYSTQKFGFKVCPLSLEKCNTSADNKNIQPWLL